MYVVVGQSGQLEEVMDNALDTELERELRWFILSLFGGVFILFVAFAIVFERRLQMRVTRPIIDLKDQLKNPR